MTYSSNLQRYLCTMLLWEMKMGLAQFRKWKKKSLKILSSAFWSGVQTLDRRTVINCHVFNLIHFCVVVTVVWFCGYSTK